MSEDITRQALINGGEPLTTKRLEAERLEASTRKFGNVKPDRILTSIWGRLSRAFEMRKSHLPVVMKGFSRSALKRAIKNCSREDVPISIDGEDYVLVTKSKYTREISPF